MRKIVFLVFIAGGTAAGLIAALTDDWGLRIVMMTIGAIAGGAIGGAVSRIVSDGRATPDVGRDVLPGLGTTGDDLVDNYWRDKGRTQLTSALEPEHGRHQFDPDKL
jgi:hypothetical protein